MIAKILYSILLETLRHAQITFLQEELHSNDVSILRCNFSRNLNIFSGIESVSSHISTLPAISTQGYEYRFSNCGKLTIANFYKLHFTLFTSKRRFHDTGTIQYWMILAIMTRQRLVAEVTKRTDFRHKTQTRVF